MKTKKKALTILLLLLLTAAAGVATLGPGARIDIEKLRLEPCRIFYDRNGRVLRFVPNAKFERHLWIDKEDIPQHVREAFIAAEDQRFYNHPGVDFLAVLRAAKNNLIHGRIVSGASTVTQQLVRMAYPRPRSFIAKFTEALRAVRLEATLTKDDIMIHYLNRAPFGASLYGIEAAALFYFGKRTCELTTAEAAALASLPKAPSLMSPHGKNRKRLMERKDWVLSRMHRCGFLTQAQLEREKSRPVFFQPRHFPMEAPHAVDALHNTETRKKCTGVFHTTIDLDVQKRLEAILLSHRARLSSQGASQAAAVILRNEDSSVLALAGSLEYSHKDGGFNNGALALRSPGSALKPFLYALALDSGYSAASILEDLPARYPFSGGVYHPLNFDRKTYGPVMLRDALANSLNLPAVYLLNRIGCNRFYAVLDKLKLVSAPEKGPDHYGLGMVVGNIEVSLLRLASAYAALANGGLYRSPRFLLEDLPEEERQVFSPQAAWVVTNILSEPASRGIIFGGSQGMSYPYRIAVKTGTSTEYRDSWAVAYTKKHTIGVWTGNFDGQPTGGLSGANGASLVLADILSELHRMGGPAPYTKPEGIARCTVCAFSGMKPNDGCLHTKEEWFVSGAEPEAPCTYHRNDENYHALPSRYAGWVAERYQKGIEGRFRLSEFDQDLEKTFSTNAEGADNEAKPDPPVVTGPATIPSYPDARPNSTRARQAMDGRSIAITSPLDGDNYIMDRRQSSQKIRLSAVCKKPYKEVVWFIDGMEYASIGPPYTIEWQLERGRHKIAVVGPGHTGDSVAIEVQ